MAFPCMRAEAVLMLLPIMRSSSRDSACSDSTASPGNSLAAKRSQTLDSFSSLCATFNLCRRNQREAKGTRMGRRQAAKADGGGIGREEDFKATASNPRGLDARAFTKKTGAPDECALDTS